VNRSPTRVCARGASTRSATSRACPLPTTDMMRPMSMEVGAGIGSGMYGRRGFLHRREKEHPQRLMCHRAAVRRSELEDDVRRRRLGASRLHVSRDHPSASLMRTGLVAFDSNTRIPGGSETVTRVQYPQRPDSPNPPKLSPHALRGPAVGPVESGGSPHAASRPVIRAQKVSTETLSKAGVVPFSAWNRMVTDVPAGTFPAIPTVCVRKQAARHCRPAGSHPLPCGRVERGLR